MLRKYRLPAEAAGGLQDPLALNCLYLSGVMLADPRLDKGRDGEPVTLLLVAFPAPDSKETAELQETASCEVEVPMEVIEKHSQEPRAGDSILLTGQLGGGGGVIATSLHTGSPPDQIIDVVSDN